MDGALYYQLMWKQFLRSSHCFLSSSVCAIRVSLRSCATTASKLLAFKHKYIRFIHVALLASHTVQGNRCVFKNDNTEISQWSDSLSSFLATYGY